MKLQKGIVWVYTAVFAFVAAGGVLTGMYALSGNVVEAHNSVATHITFRTIQRFGNCACRDPCDPWDIDVCLQASKPATAMSLLLISHNLEVQGAPLYLLNLARILQHMGYIVAVASSEHGALYTAYANAGIEVNICSDTACFINLMRQNTVSVVNTLFLTPVIWAAAQHAHPLKVIWVIHESDRLTYQDAFPEIASHDVFELPQYVVFVSCETAQLYMDVNTGNFRVIHGFVNPELERWGRQFAAAANHTAMHQHAKWGHQKKRSMLRARLGASKDSIVITVVGTICYRKAQFPFVKAIHHVFNTRPALKQRVLVLLIGDDDPPSIESQLIRKYIRQHHLTKNVLFVNSHMTANEMLHAADIHWSNSLSESFPLNILEAMVLGVPVVSSQVHGLNELTNTESASTTTYPPGNSGALIDTMLTVLNDTHRPELRRMAEAAYQHVHAHFTSQHAVTRWHAILSSMQT